MHKCNGHMKTHAQPTVKTCKIETNIFENRLFDFLSKGRKSGIRLIDLWYDDQETFSNFNFYRPGLPFGNNTFKTMFLQVGAILFRTYSVHSKMCIFSLNSKNTNV